MGMDMQELLNKKQNSAKARQAELTSPKAAATPASAPIIEKPKATAPQKTTTGKNPELKTMTISITKADFKKLKELALEKEMSVSALIREWIAEH